METRSDNFKSQAVSKIQRKFRYFIRNRTIIQIVIRPTMVFILNPYNQVLDLTDISYLKLYMAKYSSLEKEVKFDGKRQNNKILSSLSAKRWVQEGLRRSLR